MSPSTRNPLGREHILSNSLFIPYWVEFPTNSPLWRSQDAWPLLVMQLSPKIRPLSPRQPVSLRKCCSIWNHSQFSEQQLILDTKPVGDSLDFFKEQRLLCISSHGAGGSYRSTVEISHQSGACSAYSNRWWNVNQLTFKNNVGILARDRLLSSCTFWDHFIWLVLMELGCYQMALCRVASGMRKM